jgi:hypothetical protein
MGIVCGACKHVNGFGSLSCSNCGKRLLDENGTESIPDTGVVPSEPGTLASKGSGNGLLLIGLLFAGAIILVLVLAVRFQGGSNSEAGTVPAQQTASTEPPATTSTESGSPQQDEHAAENAAYAAKINAQPEFTSIPIISVSELDDKVFGLYRNQEDMTGGELEGTMVAVEGVVSLTGPNVDEAPAKIWVHSGKDGEPDAALVRLRAVDALTLRQGEQRIVAGLSFEELPAAYNPSHTVNAMLWDAYSARRASDLHDGDRIVIVGQFMGASSGTIDISFAHIPAASEIMDDHIVVSRPVSVRDMQKPWTW